MTATSHDVLIRPMRPADVLPGTDRAGENRARHLLRTDPEGCWVAEVGGTIVGHAMSFTRELLWGLASYDVREDLRGQGVGTQLLAAAAHHGRGCLRGMLLLPTQPDAVRRARRAGFRVQPTLVLTGGVDRSTLPVVERVREGSAADVDLLDSIGRRVRAAAHGPDHEVLLAEHHLLVTDRPSGSGFAYVDAGGVPVLLAATNRRTATDLFWEALAATPEDAVVTVRHLTPTNEWALDVGLAAGLAVHTSGYLGLRGMKPPSPYLPHESWL